VRGHISLVTVDDLRLRSTFRLIITQTLRYAYIQASTLLRYAFQNQKRRARAARTAKKAEVARLIALEAEVQTAEGLRVSMANMAIEFPQATNLVAALTQVLSSAAQTEV
jgi:glucan phosphorylase